MPISCPFAVKPAKKPNGSGSRAERFGQPTEFAGLSADADERVDPEQLAWADRIAVMEKAQLSRLKRQLGQVLKESGSSAQTFQTILDSCSQNLWNFLQRGSDVSSAEGLAPLSAPPSPDGGNALHLRYLVQDVSS